MAVFKNMVLDCLKKDNYKELSRRMLEVGWTRTNDQCRHEILHLQERYDKLVEMSKKTGGAYHFDPLHAELQDTFGAMTNVAPESVFSSMEGHEDNPNSLSDEDSTNKTEVSTTTPKKDVKKKQAKSKYSSSLYIHYILVNNKFFKT